MLRKSYHFFKKKSILFVGFFTSYQKKFPHTVAKKRKL